ncbi:MAG TPA: hypothetical protein VKU00_22675 [Chthonomonadaceae bacterium]|nr:hypothetical protein [Chthonomonadaceae bacterium]
MRSTRIVAIGIAISLVLGLVLSALADEIADARKAMKALQADYSKIDAAANAKNVKGFLAYNAPEYVIVDKSDAIRVQNGPDMEAGYAAFFAASLSYKQQTSVQKLTLHGKEAVVTVKQHIERSANDANSNKRVKSVMNGILEETWTQSDKGWQRTRTKALEMHATENGQKINAH